MINRRNCKVKHSTAGVWYNNGAGQRYLSHEVTNKTTASYIICNDDGTTTSALAIFAGHLSEREVLAFFIARDKNETANRV